MSATTTPGPGVDVAPLHPLGVRVTGLAVGGIDDGQVMVLRRLLADHGVVVLPDQDIDDAAFVAFLRCFGPLAFSTGETPLPGFPDLNEVSNVGRSPRSSFHVDTSYVRRPPAYTALRAVTVPARGGETLFTDQYRAYDTLPDPVRAELAGRTIRHVVTGLELGPDEEAAADHPLFRPHPLSGRTALYLTSPARCAAISGMDDASTRTIVEHLLAHSTGGDTTYRHPWRPGDVVMWDNGCVLHCADHDGVVGDRVLHRGMVATYDGGP